MEKLSNGHSPANLSNSSTRQKFASLSNSSTRQNAHFRHFGQTRYIRPTFANYFPRTRYICQTFANHFPRTRYIRPTFANHFPRTRYIRERQIYTNLASLADLASVDWIVLYIKISFFVYKTTYLACADIGRPTLPGLDTFDTRYIRRHSPKCDSHSTHSHE